ncbi:unnamed protein product [Closterium sp. Yama58-4]|nr:unnamed protein product [Closterium sp. Yama58-4]
MAPDAPAPIDVHNASQIKCREFLKLLIIVALLDLEEDNGGHESWSCSDVVTRSGASIIRIRLDQAPSPTKILNLNYFCTVLKPEYKFNAAREIKLPPFPLFSSVPPCHITCNAQPGGLTMPLLNKNFVSGQASQTRLSIKATRKRFQPPHIQHCQLELRQLFRQQRQQRHLPPRAPPFRTKTFPPKAWEWTFEDGGMESRAGQPRAARANDQPRPVETVPTHGWGCR